MVEVREGGHEQACPGHEAHGTCLAAAQRRADRTKYRSISEDLHVVDEPGRCRARGPAVSCARAGGVVREGPRCRARGRRCRARGSEVSCARPEGTCSAVLLLKVRRRVSRAAVLLLGATPPVSRAALRGWFAGGRMPSPTPRAARAAPFEPPARSRERSAMVSKSSTALRGLPARRRTSRADAPDKRVRRRNIHTGPTSPLTNRRCLANRPTCRR
jgi:hypothetical protein